MLNICHCEMENYFYINKILNSDINKVTCLGHMNFIYLGRRIKRTSFRLLFFRKKIRKLTFLLDGRKNLVKGKEIHFNNFVILCNLQ